MYVSMLYLYEVSALAQTNLGSHEMSRTWRLDCYSNGSHPVESDVANLTCEKYWIKVRLYISINKLKQI